MIFPAVFLKYSSRPLKSSGPTQSVLPSGVILKIIIKTLQMSAIFLRLQRKIDFS